MSVIPEFRASEISGTEGRHAWPWIPALGLSPEAGMTAWMLRYARTGVRVPTLAQWPR